VGTNVYSRDWEKIASKVRACGANVIAGDFSNFDGTLHTQILFAILDVINDWYDDGPGPALVRRVLWAEIVHSIHIVRGVVYGWTHSQPSGCPITAVLNSCYNSISMRYVWLSLARRYSPEHASMYCFHKHVSMVSYGDDNVVGISDDVPWFNQITISEGYVELGMVYTDESKSGELVAYRTLEDVGFLKRKFVWNEDICRLVAPLDLSGCLETMNWVRPGLDVLTATVENVQNSMFEIALHGREEYKKYSALVQKAFSDIGQRIRLPSYEDQIGARLSEAIAFDPDFQM